MTRNFSADRYAEQLGPSIEDTMAPLYDALTNYIRALSDLRDDWRDEGLTDTVKLVEADIATAKKLRDDLNAFSFGDTGKRTIEFWKNWAEWYRG